MVDKALLEALDEVVEEAGQPQAVARRVKAWLTRMGEGEISWDEKELFLKNVCNELVTEARDADSVG